MYRKDYYLDTASHYVNMLSSEDKYALFEKMLSEDTNFREQMMSHMGEQ